MPNVSVEAPSRAASRYLENLKDDAQLVGIHSAVGGSGPGRRDLDVVNKAGIVLLCAIWEAYCEDLADEALQSMIRRLPAPDRLPEHLRRKIVTDLGKHELAPWKLAGEGWRTVLAERSHQLREKRNHDLNTPKAEQVRNMFADTLGIADVTSAWRWPKVSPSLARARLDRLVTQRGDIVHRGASNTPPIWKKDLYASTNHITRLVARTDTRVASFLQEAAGPLPTPSLYPTQVALEQ